MSYIKLKKRTTIYFVESTTSPLPPIFGKVIFRTTGFNIQMTSFDKQQKLVPLPLDIFLNGEHWYHVQQANNKILEKKFTFGHTKCLSKKNQNRLWIIGTPYNFFSHLHIRADKFTIKYLFSIHAHRYHANLRKHGCLGTHWSVPTHYDKGMSLHYA